MLHITSAALIILFVTIVESYPLCQQITSGPTCTTNLTANITVLDEWLSLHDNSEGIDQLRSHKDSSIASILLNLTTTMHDDCLSAYQSMVIAPQSVNASVDNIRSYFNAYLMHKAYVEYLVVNLSAVGLLNKGWVQISTVGDVHDRLKELLKALKYNVRNLAQLLNNTCSGCTQNCSRSEDKSALLISTMEDCENPLHNVVFVIAEHSVNLYKTINNLKRILPKDQLANDDNVVKTLLDDDDNLCWCSVDYEKE